MSSRLQSESFQPEGLRVLTILKKPPPQKAFLGPPEICVFLPQKRHDEYMFTERRLVRDRTGCQNVAIDLRFTLQLRGKLDVRSPRTMPRDLSRIKHYYKKIKNTRRGFPKLQNQNKGADGRCNNASCSLHAHFSAFLKLWIDH